MEGVHNPIIREQKPIMVMKTTLGVLGAHPRSSIHNGVMAPYINGLINVFDCDYNPYKWS